MTDDLYQESENQSDETLNKIFRLLGKMSSDLDEIKRKTDQNGLKLYHIEKKLEKVNN